MKSSKEYRMEAKSALAGKWGSAILAFIIFSLISGACVPTFIGGLLLNGALNVGFCFAMLQPIRSGKMTIANLFHGFTGNFVSTIVMSLLTAIYTFLWSLLFIIPGIIKSYSYSMAPYILADHPEISGEEAITASKKLMSGKKWKLFCIQFGFIGWMILSLFTFGILLLWIIPWMEAAKAALYESVKDEVVIEG